MKNIFTSLQHSYSVRALILGILTLVLLIPLAMVRGVIEDRQMTGVAARDDIIRSWGAPQTVGTPLLVLPCRWVAVSQYGERIESDGRLYASPLNLRFDVELKPDSLHRGIHEVPVYTAEVLIRGEWPSADRIESGVDGAEIDWARASVALAISDPRAIRNVPVVEVGDRSARFGSGGQQVSFLPPQIAAEIGAFAGAEASQETRSFSIRLEVGGTDALRFLPLGESTAVSMRSRWPSPSFTGAYLPVEREVSDTGFSATWRISNLGSPLPSLWASTNPDIAGPDTGPVDLNTFGVALFVPVSLYHSALRATKYGVLFVGLTFVCYFLFEVLARLRLHPLQYLLVGFANTLFYLLLLSLAEHLGFGWSYLLSAIASSALITGYSLAVLERRSRAFIMLAVLGLLYAFLYMTLKADTYAMLAGSIGLWLILALIMYLTRAIDWHRNIEAPLDEPAGRPASGL